MNAYTPADVMELFRADLAAWAAEHKATVLLARDAWSALSLLLDGPAALRLILNWGGDEPLGDQPEALASAHAIEVYVSCNLGLAAEPDAALARAGVKRPSLLESVHAVRERILSLSVLDHETGEPLSARYAGCEPVVTPEGIPLASYKIKTWFDAAFPDYAAREVDAPLAAPVDETQ